MRRLFIITFGLVALGFASVAYGAEWTTQFQDSGASTYNSAYTNNTPQQSFYLPTDTYVKSIQVEMYRSNPLLTLVMRLCKRNTATSTLNRYCAGDNSLIYESADIKANIPTTTLTWFNWSVNATTTAGYYYFLIDAQSSPANYLYNYYNSASDLYINGSSTKIISNASLNYDLNFRIWESNNYPSSSTPSSTVPVSSGLGYTTYSYPFVYLNEEYYCRVGSACDIDFTFNGYANSHDIYFYQAQDYGDSTPIPPVLASTTLGLYAFGTTTLSIPYSSAWAGNKVPMCAWVHDPFNYDTDRLQCGWTVWWLTDAQWAQILGITNCDGSYDIGSACNSVASSTGSYFDDFRYGIECGTRKTSYWLFTRSDDSCRDMVETMTDLKGVFPLNVFADIKNNMLKLASTSTTATSTMRVGLPLWVKGGSVYISNIDLFNPHMIGDALGDLWTTINDGLSYLVYFLGIIWLINELNHEKGRNIDI